MIGDGLRQRFELSIDELPDRAASVGFDANEEPRACRIGAVANLSLETAAYVGGGVRVHGAPQRS